MRYMLDTNICIYTIKRKPEQVFRHLQGLKPEQICISAVTYAELMHGVEKSREKDRNRLALTLLLSHIEILAFDDTAAQEYGRIRAELEINGTPIGPLDMMIAGHAVSRGCMLVTNNEKEFERVRGLPLENWAAE